MDVTGDVGPAHALMAELKETLDKKRDTKWMAKQYHAADKRADKDKALAAIWKDVEERYVNTLIRAPVDPVLWINTEFPKSEENAPYWKLFVTGKLKYFKEYYRDAVALNHVEPVFEDIEETLEKYVTSRGVMQPDLECLKLVVSAGHGKIIREVVRLMFGERTKERTLWISGVANSGKSMLIRRIREIFASDEVDWRGVYMPIRHRNLPQIKTQLLSFGLNFLLCQIIKPNKDSMAKFISQMRISTARIVWENSIT